MTKQSESALTNCDKLNIAVQGGLRAVPYVGPALEHFIYGGVAELRMKRIEETLTEVARALGESKATLLVQEDFVNLLEEVAPDLARATNDDKRRRFRDLLTNASGHPAGSAEWEEARLAGLLLKELEVPALAILVALSRVPDEAATLTSRPVSQLFRGEFDWEAPGQPQEVLPFEWVVVDYWARLLRERQLIHYTSHDARGGFGGVLIAERGRFLTRWILKAD